MATEKTKPQERDRLMQQVRAAKTYIGTIHNADKQEQIELAAFMAIFHPNRTLSARNGESSQ
jgi:hypothetical protein